MNISRYALAATVSIAVHAGVFSQFEVKNAFAMQVGQQATSISLQLVKPATIATTPTQKPHVLKKDVVKSDNAEMHSPTQPIPEPQTSSKAKTPAPKKQPKQMPKATPLRSKEPIAERSTSKASKQASNKAPAKPAVKVADKPVNEPDVTPQTASVAAKAGVAETPVLVEQPAFVTPPTKPKYPRLSQRRGIEGTAMYEIWLDENGNQIKQNLLSSSGASMLDKAALDAIKQWKFSPRTVNGVSMAHRVQIPIRFKLD